MPLKSRDRGVLGKVHWEVRMSSILGQNLNAIRSSILRRWGVFVIVNLCTTTSTMYIEYILTIRLRRKGLCHDPMKQTNNCH